ncbi:MAG: hypothetical protein GXY92_08525 [Syntrophomonadaceae bacterium]|nr:hypothetical protein [Syntrophomonadaceae bacterium]
MLRIYNRSFKGRRGMGGFTVLELLAVFAILAIIVALAAPRFAAVIQESKLKACENNVEMIRKAAEMYYEVKGEWPTEQELAEEGYIEEYIYCPLADTKNEDTAYDIDEEGNVTCKNEDNHSRESGV